MTREDNDQLKPIRSVSGYINCIISIYKRSVHFRSADLSSTTFYRGHANIDWDLDSRLYREKLFDNERTLIKELIRVRPEEFKDLSDIDRLIKMQHYGLPTRLLDMTTNPLVALFFACWSLNEREVDGLVYVFPPQPIFRSHNLHIRRIAYYVSHRSRETVELDLIIDEFREKGLISSSIQVAEARKEIKTTLTIPYYAISPNLTNDRIRIQEGSFFLSGMREVVDSKETTKPKQTNKIQFEPHYLSSSPLNLFSNAITISIPSSAKAKILDELNLLGLSKARLFPELEHQAAYVTNLVQTGGMIRE